MALVAAPAGGVEMVHVSLEAIREETRCPICFGVLKQTRLVKDCLHRFCAPCIERSLRINKNECPACRVHLNSRRALQPDPGFDAICTALYGNVEAFEQAEEEYIAAENARSRQVWSGISAALEAQRARTGYVPASEAVSRPGRKKRPRWGDAYDDYAELDEEAEAEVYRAEAGGSRRGGGAGGAHLADPDADDFGPDGPDAPRRQPGGARQYGGGGGGGGAGGRQWAQQPQPAPPRPRPVPPPPPEPFPAASALGRSLLSASTVIHMRVQPDAEVPPAAQLPLVEAPYLCVPQHMTVASLEKLLLAQLAALPGDPPALPPGSRLALREGGAPAPDWMALGRLRQRFDARADAPDFCVTYSRKDVPASQC